MKRKTLSLLLLPLFLGAEAPSVPSAKLCLTPKPYGRAFGFRNFLYEGRIEVSDPAYAYWVAAIEGSGKAIEESSGEPVWIQSAFVRGRSNSVAFGVHNGSAYPLHFVVLRADTQALSEELRHANRSGSPFTLSEIKSYPIVSDFNACTFDLDDPAGLPSDSGLCSCRQ